jgi:hypothetical protein
MAVPGTSKSKDYFNADRGPPIAIFDTAEEDDFIMGDSVEEEFCPTGVKRRRLEDDVDHPPQEDNYEKRINVRVVDVSSTRKDVIVCMRGTHSISEHTFETYHQDSPLPLKNTQSRRVPILMKAIQSKMNRRPHLSDTNVEEYITNAKKPNTRFHPLSMGTFDMSGKSIHFYTDAYQKKYYALNCSKTVRCRVCDKPIGFVGKSVNPERGKYFRPCCLPAPTYMPIVSDTVTPFTYICGLETIVYDLETYNDYGNGGSGEHKVYCVGVRTMDGSKSIVESIEKFLDIVIKSIDILILRWEQAREDKVAEIVARQEERGDHSKNLSTENIEVYPFMLQLVSFNGSRYDDLFIAKAFRQRIIDRYGLSVFKSIGYSERKRAITHNNVVFRTKDGHKAVKLEWCDVLRFTNPTSLGAAARDYKLAVMKGNMPFTVLNDYCLGRDVLRDDDYFFSLKYFDGDTVKRDETIEYYKSVVGPHTRESTVANGDVALLCHAYCLQDVEVTHLLYVHLRDMFTRYLGPLVVPDMTRPHCFYPMARHSMASLCYRVMVYSALNAEHPIYSSLSGGSRIGVPEIFAPTCDSYDFERAAVYGGWVRTYFQGLVVNTKHAASRLGVTWVHQLKQLCEAFDCPLIEDDLKMGDIASMYPNAVTFPMPVGLGRFVYDEETKYSLINQLLSTSIATKIPFFIARVRVEPPKKPTFFESTLPQRTAEGSLSWSYSTDLSTLSVYNSLDLWIACAHTMEGNDPDTVWKIVEVREMIFWDESSPLYTKFVRTCAEGKKEGTRMKNDNMRNIFKGANNSSVGKLCQRIEGRMNVIGRNSMANACELLGGRAEIVGAQPISYKYRLQEYNDIEFVLRTYDTSNNKMPQSHGGFMYAATRLMRVEWARASAPQGVPRLVTSIFNAFASQGMKRPMSTSLSASQGVTRPVITSLSTPNASASQGVPRSVTVLLPGRPVITSLATPDPWYGDTDSKIHSSHRFAYIPPSMIGGETGIFDIDTGASNMNVDVEKVSNDSTSVFLTGLLGSKTYFMASHDNDTGRQVLKFRCKGQRQFKPGVDSCSAHGKKNCSACTCPHLLDVTSCLGCIIPDLHKILSESCVQGNPIDHMCPPPPSCSLDPLYKLQSLPSLNLFSFVFTLITGVPVTTDNSLFLRNLSLATSKCPEFSVSSTTQKRTLSKPVVKTTSSPLNRLVPHLTDCVRPVDSLSLPGVLYPVGDYLFNK